MTRKAPAAATDVWISGRDPSTGRSVIIAIAAGRIAAIVPAPAEETAWLSAGFIDLQVNGYAGHDFNGADLRSETVVSAALALHVIGVTSFVPTIITTSERRIVVALEAIRQARDADPRMRRAIPFVHVEGPHIAPEDGPRGAHPLEHVRAVNLAEFERWQAASGGLVGMVTLSPHSVQACRYIAALTGSGVHIALGHTGASAAQIAAAVAAGAVLSTHLGNAVAAVLPRHPNLLWAQLADQRLTSTFIADGFHLPLDTLTVMLRAKGVRRSILVSDSVALAGQPPGLYELPIGGRVELSAAGRLGIVGTPFLAGAARPLKDGVATVAGLAGFSLGDAVRMATRNPGRFVGRRGVLRVGASADLVRFHWQPGDSTLRIANVLCQGAEI